MIYLVGQMGTTKDSFTVNPNHQQQEEQKQSRSIQNKTTTTTTTNSISNQFTAIPPQTHNYNVADYQYRMFYCLFYVMI